MNLSPEDKDVLRRVIAKFGPPDFNLQTFLFDKQYTFVSDPAPFKTAVCSRRSGKTIACAADLIHHALSFPDTPQLYVTLARTSAEKIIWAELLKINEKFKLGGTPNYTTLSLRFKNNSIIYVTGAKDKTEVDKFRGMPVKKAYIDESQSFKTDIIEYLIDEVLGAALLDYAGGISLIGTPGPVPGGYFHDCSVTSPTWSHHAWTYFDNPFIPLKSGKTHQEGLDRELQRRGVSTDDPSIQREWFGRWVLDLNSLLITYDANKNHYDQLPQAKWNYIMGIDLGFNDADAIAVLAWSESDPSTYLVEELVTTKQGLTELASQVSALQNKYDISKLMIDEGGLGKKLAEELRRRFQIPVLPADKARKMENVALLNDCLRTSRFKAKKDSRFAQDSYLLEIDRDKTTPDRIKVKDSFHSDIIDAVLYAFKESPAFTYQVPPIKHPYQSDAWAKQEVTKMEQEAQDHFERLEQAERGFATDWKW